MQRLLPFQRLNHFPGMLEICRKASLSRHMARLAARLPAQYGFYPPAMLLPDQLDELVAALKKNKARVRTTRVGTVTRMGAPGWKVKDVNVGWVGAVDTFRFVVVSWRKYRC